MALNNPYALSFDGVDDRLKDITLSNSLRTLEFWFYAPQDYFGGEAENILITLNSNLDYVALGGTESRILGTTMYLRIRNTSPARYAYSAITTPITAGWHHIALLFVDYGRCYFILDGEEIVTSFYSTAPTAGYPTRLVIGGYQAGFYGAFDELRAWSTERTVQDVQIYKNCSLSGLEEGLELYLRFDEGSGNIAVDSSPNANHGEIIGATWVPGFVDLGGDEPGQGQKVTGSITFRGRSSMSLSAVKRAIGSITFRGSSSMFLSAVKTAVGKITFRGGSFMSLVGLVLRELEGVYQISSSEIVSRNQPVLSTDLANYIEVWINPRVPADQAEEVYRSKEPEPIPPGESKAFSLKLDKEPVIEAVASLEEAGANLAITDTKFYSGSAEITVTNTGTTEQTCIIVIQAKPLELQGRRKIVVKDEESILDHGLVKYTFDSPLVQDEESAHDIGRKILWLFSVARANIEIEWRGDPALELADPVQIPEFEKLGVSKKENFYVVRQLLEVVEGGLDATLSGRKIPRLKEGD